MAMKRKAREKNLEPFIYSLKEIFNLQRSHSVQLIINTCDFLLKQLGMFFYQTSKAKIVQHLARMLEAMLLK